MSKQLRTLTLRLIPLVRPINLVSQHWYMNAYIALLDFAGVKLVGRPLWLSSRIHWDLSGPGAIELGDRCVISEDCAILTHDYSADRAAEYILGGIQSHELYRQATVKIGAMSFIGMRSILLPGVTVGAGSIVGAGSVVTNAIPPGTVAAGSPAKHLSSTTEYLDKVASKFARKDRRP